MFRTGCLESGPEVGVGVVVDGVVEVAVVGVLVTSWAVSPADGASITPGAVELPQAATNTPRASAARVAMALRVIEGERVAGPNR
jgi:hypothetical protein